VEKFGESNLIPSANEAGVLITELQMLCVQDVS
jgi:hypothetical protein